MAKKGEINTTLRLQGEKEYSQGMKNAAFNVKELDSQLKKARAEFEKNGDAQKYNAEQVEILKQKIEEQTRAAKAAEDAIKLLTENGIDKNDARVKNWQITQNNATATLYKFQAELKKAEAALEASTDEVQAQALAMKSGETSAEGYADKLDRIDKNITFSTTLEKLKLVKETVSAILSGVIEIGKGIWNYESQAAQWATEINKEAAEAGLDPAVYQSYKYAAQMLGMSIEDYADMAKELEASMMSTDETVAEAFNELGVAYRNEDGTLRSAMEVLAEVANALGSVNTQTASNVLASRLLGSEYKKLNPLINAGGDAWKYYIKEGKDIGTVSKAAFDALLELDKSRVKLSTQFQTIKTEAAGQLAPGFTAITDGLSGLLTQFDEFLESEKGQKAVEKINGFLTTIGDTIGNIDVGTAVDNFFKKFESVDLGNAIDKVSTALSSFTDGLSWIVENGDSIISWTEKIATAYGAIKVSSEVIQFMNLLKSGAGTGGMGQSGSGSTGTGGGVIAGIGRTGLGIAGILGIRQNADTISNAGTGLLEKIGVNVDEIEKGIENAIGTTAYRSVLNALSKITGAKSAYQEIEQFDEEYYKKLKEREEKYLPENKKPDTSQINWSGEVATIELDGSGRLGLFKPYTVTSKTKTEEYIAALEKAKEEEARAKAEQEAALKRLVEETGGSTGEIIVNGASAIAFGESPETESLTVPQGAFTKAVEEQLAESAVLSKEMEAAVTASVDDYIANLLKEIEANTKAVEEAKEAALVEPLSNLDSAIEAAGSAGANAAAAYAAGIESQLFRVTSATARLIAASQPSGRFQNAPYLTGASYVGGNVYIDGQLAGNVLAPTMNENLGIFASGR